MSDDNNAKILKYSNSVIYSLRQNSMESTVERNQWIKCDLCA